MQTVVGVLRGGPSREHEVSLKTGASLLRALSPERFEPRDIYIDQAGQWHERGRRVEPQRILRQIDVALLALHGEYGEDGTIQRLLERHGVPYTGSNATASALAMHKILSKHHALEAHLKTPAFHHVAAEHELAEAAHHIVRNFVQPVILKPVQAGSSVGVVVAGGYADVLRALETLRADGVRDVLVEELVRGREVTVGVVEGLRGEELYALPVIEIVLPEGGFFSYDAKYNQQTREECPARLPRDVAQELQQAARTMHRALGLRHYSRSDFIVTKHGVQYLETNTLPGLTEQSLLPKSLSAVGVEMPEFVEHLIDQALA